MIDVSDILKYADPMHPEALGAPDYDKYHESSLECPPHAEIVTEYRNKLAEGFIPLVVTARQEKYRRTTCQWLYKYSLYPVEMHFRRDGDERPDQEVKGEILDELLEHYDIVAAWDDNPHVIEYWKSRGIPVRVVPSWPEWRN